MGGKDKETKIIIKIKGVEYSLEEAKELKEFLDNLFGQREIQYIPYFPQTTYPIPECYTISGG